MTRKIKPLVEAENLPESTKKELEALAKLLVEIYLYDHCKKASHKARICDECRSKRVIFPRPKYYDEPLR